jgi:hypothetical protein
LQPDVCDLEGRPYILMRANLWFDGDPSHPSVGDLCQLLMWIGEQLAKSVQVSEFFFFGSFLSQCWLTVSLHWVHLCHGHERLDKTQLFDSCVSFSSRVSKKIFHPFFFFPPSYTQLMHMIQDCLPVRCEQFIFLDVPKVFSASWKLVSTSLKPSFKKIMAISNRQGEKVVLSFSNVDDVVRLCGALH